MPRPTPTPTPLFDRYPWQGGAPFKWNVPATPATPKEK